MEEKSLKEATGKRYRAKVKEAAIRIGHQPPFNDMEVIVLLKSLHEDAVGQTTADQYRLAISWWHQISGHHDPCGKQTARLCDAMHRDLPNIARQPSETTFHCDRNRSHHQALSDKKQIPRRRVGSQWHPVRHGPQHGIEN